MGKASRYFTDAEMKALLRAVRAKAAGGGLVDKVDHTLIVCAWATGCRAGELASISMDTNRPNHIDTEAGIVVIDEAKWDTKGIVPLDRASQRVLRRDIREHTALSPYGGMAYPKTSAGSKSPSREG